MKMPGISLLEWQKRYGTERACVQELAKGNLEYSSIQFSRMKNSKTHLKKAVLILIQTHISRFISGLLARYETIFGRRTHFTHAE